MMKNSAKERISIDRVIELIEEEKELLALIKAKPT